MFANTQSGVNSWSVRFCSSDNLNKTYTKLPEASYSKVLFFSPLPKVCLNPLSKVGLTHPTLIFY